jgi:hypothetical protein
VPVSVTGIPSTSLNGHFTTADVLCHEFQFIHGMPAWHRPDRQGDPERRTMIEQATQGLAGEAADQAERIALHAWAAKCLPGAGQSALCLSGGGIRSAAFAFGILQGFARRGLLEQFHYLSTVSGGGYIGSWFTAWRHRAGLDEVLKRLRRRQFGEFAEAEPVQRLRFNQNFLTPRVGVGSADTWAAIATIIRNLLLNWLVYLPLLACVLLWPRIVKAFIDLVRQSEAHSSMKALFDHWLPDDGKYQYPCAMLLNFSAWRCWLDTAGVLLVLFGFTVSVFNRPASGPTSMTNTSFVKWVVTPVFLGALLLTAAVSGWLENMNGSRVELLTWALLGALVYVSARLAAIAVRLIAVQFAVLRHLGHRHKWEDLGLLTLRAMRRAMFQEERTPRGAILLVLEVMAWAVAGLCTGVLIGASAQFLHGLAFPGGAMAEPTADLDDLWTEYIVVFGPPTVLVCFLIGEAVFVGVSSRLPSGERDREWLARAGGWFGVVAVTYLIVSWLVVFGWDDLLAAGWLGRGIVGGSGLLTILGAMTPLTRAVAANGKREKLPLTRIVAMLAGLFVVGASAALAKATYLFLGEAGGRLQFLGLHRVRDVPDRMFSAQDELIYIIGLSLAFLLLSSLVSFFVNVNWFSLHAMYRNRLVKTFLGASNVGSVANEKRNAFDGFSEGDNIAMSELVASINRERDNRDSCRLYPVLNMSLNVLASKNLAWQERKAESFICSPLYTGSALYPEGAPRTGGARVGYRSSTRYATGRRRSKGKTDRGISLGTAMAISGAAVSPNWGYHSSPMTSFLMMLANVRLGWWLGNPRSKNTWRRRGPMLSWRLFVQEAFGWTDDDAPWVYLSDGGHFENLGLYEMIRRRCRTIVVSDAGADPQCTLDDLGNAVRKVSIDLGVKIEFRRIDVRKRSDVAAAGVYCALGDIVYPDGEKGQILYIKPGFYGAKEPADVRAYAAANAKFPHESTMNQWFGESQFESYRSLGSYVIEEICGGQAELGLEAFMLQARNYLRRFEQDYVTDGATVVEIRRPVRLAGALARARA